MAHNSVGLTAGNCFEGFKKRKAEGSIKGAAFGSTCLSDDGMVCETASTMEAKNSLSVACNEEFTGTCSSWAHHPEEFDSK